ncbi:MAG: tRNA preQ1(34) S-adenosylmethionine ribosyltransferase-isomerase QueA [Atopobiaceae bacterium]|nr:tRNA preQ1(34) S-adenosylmethionine ribosyltransferase-isomerase QueA [Atopobiaceae bacterium]
MRTSDFDYALPDELIAQSPAEPRDSCRLLVLDRTTGAIEHRHFFDIIDYLHEGDLLVANETRVLPARLKGTKHAGTSSAEMLLLRRREDEDPLGFVWECLVSPGRRLKPGACVDFFGASAEPVLTGEVLSYVEDSRGGRLVRFQPQNGRTLDQAIHAAGQVPLPPYITSYEGDPEKYQTVYATQEERSAAAPTAGLHFTPELIEALKAKGCAWQCVELEVGLDTFRVVEEEDPEKHIMHTERYHVSQEVVDAVRATKEAGGRVIAVGTTAVRSLESAWEDGELRVKQGATTNLFLRPGSDFHVVDALITNFHVPRSTLMMLVSAFATREHIMTAYTEAINQHYRFLSFGDAMFIQ